MRPEQVINLAWPGRTREQAVDTELAKWAALKVHQARRGAVRRAAIQAELAAMTEQQQSRARHWLNHYRAQGEQG